MSRKARRLCSVSSGVRRPRTDRANPNSPAYRIRTTDPYNRIAGQLPVQTLSGYFDTYRIHADTKTADTTGQPTRRHTRGLLQPRTIRAIEIIRVGKEHNRLAEGLILDSQHRAQRYPEPQCRNCNKPLTGKQREWCSARCRIQHGRRKI